MNKQQTKIFIMTIIIGAFVLLLGTTYAYFQVRIIENQEKESINVTSKILEVTYIDGTAEFSGSHDGYVFPGETFKKYFAVENTGEDLATFNIVLKNITNNFTRKQDWTYQLGVVTDTNGDGNINAYDQVNYITQTPTQFPDTSEIVTIYSNYNIPHQEKRHFVLVVNYANSDEDQSIDMNQTLIAKIDITSEIINN